MSIIVYVADRVLDTIDEASGLGVLRLRCVKTDWASAHLGVLIISKNFI